MAIEGPAAKERWDPYLQGLLAFEAGDERATITVIDDMGDVDALPAARLFRSEAEMPGLERIALDLCRGRVLDLGAGAGSHALALQARGHPVTAVEVLPELVDLLQRRGVEDAREGSLFDPFDGEWDTVLMLMNGWGLTGTLPGLERFLAGAERLLAPGGVIVADSTDMRPWAVETPGAEADVQACRDDGRYVGEVQFQLQFDGRRGHPFSFLYVDPETLEAVAGRTGWRVDIAGRGANGAYLSVLGRSGA